MKDYCVWDGSVIQGEDGLWHLFASHWAKRYSMQPDWLFLSKVVGAVSDRIEGPYEFRKVVLPTRDPSFFDGRITHNQSIRQVGDTYLLFNLGLSLRIDVPEDPSKLGSESIERTDPWCRKV